MEDIEERALSSLQIYRGFGKDGDDVICTVLKKQQQQQQQIQLFANHLKSLSNGVKQLVGSSFRNPRGRITTKVFRKSTHTANVYFLPQDICFCIYPLTHSVFFLHSQGIFIYLYYSHVCIFFIGIC